MKILYGVQPPDSGTIEINGQQVTLHSPADAIKAGVGMVFQHFMLADNLTVLENVVLGAEKLHGIGGDARAEVKRISDAYGLDIEPDRLVEELGVGARQRVEILKVLYRGAQHRDPRRADRRPGAAGGRRALRQPARAQGGGHLGHLHQPQARRGALRRRRDHRDPARHDGADRAADRGHRPPAGRADGRLRAALAQHRDLDGHRRGAAVGPAPQPARAGRPAAARRHHLRHPQGRGARHRRRRGQRPGRARRVDHGHAARRDRHRSSSPARTSPAQSTRERREAGIGYIPEDRHRHGLLLDAPLWENRVLGHQSRPPERQGPADRQARRPRRHRADHQGVRRPHARARRAGPRALRRQPAEADRRPRDERRADPADRRAPDPRRRRRRPGGDLGATSRRPAATAWRCC